MISHVKSFVLIFIEKKQKLIFGIFTYLIIGFVTGVDVVGTIILVLYRYIKLLQLIGTPNHQMSNSDLSKW